MNQVLRPSAALLRWVALLALAALVPGVLSALAIEVPEQAARLLPAVLLLLLVLVLADAVRAMRLPSPYLQRQVPASLQLERWHEIRLELAHTGKGVLHLQVFDHVPQSMAFEQLPQRLTLPPRERACLQYRLSPRQRGHVAFEHCEVILRSPLGLWETRRYLAAPAALRVYPAFARLYDGPLTGVDNRLSRIGVRQHPRRGQGQEFHQLRDYREGDSLRQIDWKATARYHTPITREYQDERDQQILLLLDCGRRMHSQDEASSHFDHALNACLLLAHIALRQGDAVGLSTFAGKQERHVPPGKGQVQLNRLLNTVFDLHSTQRPADYTAAAQQLLARQKRRALVILVTNLRDEDDEPLLLAVRQLRRQHRVLVASLREGVFERLRQQPVASLEQALTYCGAVEFINARSQLHERLVALGVPVVDARPDAMGTQLINHYLGWKKAGAL